MNFKISFLQRLQAGTSIRETLTRLPKHYRSVMTLDNYVNTEINFTKSFSARKSISDIWKGKTSQQRNSLAAVFIKRSFGRVQDTAFNSAEPDLRQISFERFSVLFTHPTVSSTSLIVLLCLHSIRASRLL